MGKKPKKLPQLKKGATSPLMKCCRWNMGNFFSQLGLTNRQALLYGAALILLVLVVARWISEWGLVTIHAKNQQIGKVIASIARQGHLRIESAVDPTKLVSLEVVKVTPVEAVESLAAGNDISWRAVCVAAPSKAMVNEAVATLTGTGRIEDWSTSYYPGPPVGMDMVAAIDPRNLTVTLEGPDHDLAKLMDETSQKSGVMTALPKDWNPSPTQRPKSDAAGKVIAALVASAHGVRAEFLFLTERQHRDWGDTEGQAPRVSGGGEGDPSRPSGNETQAGVNSAPNGNPPPAAGPTVQNMPWGARPGTNPDWMEQRQIAQIKKLPKDQQLQAMKDREERKAFFDSLKGLSREERTAKIQDMMANTELGQKIQDSRLLQDAKQSTQRRINRAVSYLNRKAAAKSAQTAQGH